jgi:hypothetical protein
MAGSSATSSWRLSCLVIGSGAARSLLRERQLHAVATACIGAGSRCTENLFGNSSPMPITRTTISFTLDEKALKVAEEEAERKQ